MQGKRREGNVNRNGKKPEMEVHSYKEDNERLMREQSQINAQVLQSLNQLQR